MAKILTKSIRLDTDESERLAQVSQAEGISESALMKRLIRKGLAQYQLEQAIVLYQRGEVDLSAAAHHASISIYQMMTELENHDITLPATAQKFAQGLQALVETFGGSDALQELVNNQ